MAKRTLRGGAMLGPLPTALVTCGAEGRDNIITVAWTGILCTQPPKAYIAVRPTRYSHELLSKNGEFILHPTPATLSKTADYCGMFTGRKVDKFEKCHLTREAADSVSVPRIAECPLALECRVYEVKSLGTHDLFMADILSVSVEDALFDQNGKIHMEKADLCAYLHGEYFALGKRLGNFGFSAVKKKKRKAPGNGKGKDQQDQ